MFRYLLSVVKDPPSGTATKLTKANAVLAVHPLQMSRWLEEVWSAGGIADPANWGSLLLDGTSNLPIPVPLGDVSKTKLPAALLDDLRSGVDPNATDPTPAQPYSGNPGIGLAPLPPIWDHLLYAYLVESTGVFEILGDVVRRYVVGETLPTPSVDTAVWVRSTEELFFRDPPLFSAGGLLTSQLRPDAAVNRRNAYWRMFGLDLPHAHGRTNGQPWKRDVGSTLNSRFLELWNELLRQVWLGYENDSNSSGAKATDTTYIGYLCQTLSEMMQLRRRGGLLSREEFAYVTMLSWFHLTVDHDTALVTDLSANAGAGGNPADRLAAIGARVGTAPSRQARELFELADLVSPLMWAIELGIFNDPSAAEMLFKHTNLVLPATPIVAETMTRIIDLWQSATGERVKDLAVTTRKSTTPHRAAQPTKLLPCPLVPSAPPPSANGHRRSVPQTMK